ncbi:MAG TPA: DUF1499 domain-containing protein [Blastocatellia bacterium]|nr:DUF1499 domain-containing protein [Blastocatellia bacterium]
MRIVKKILLLGGLLFALLLGGVFISSAIWPRINDVKTGETPEYPELQPQHFSVAAYKAFDAALATAKDLGWEIVRADRQTGEIDAVDTTRILRFKDDVTITIKPGVGENCTVYVHSRSRVGKGDFGTNARRILRFQAELAKRL